MLRRFSLYFLLIGLCFSLFGSFMAHAVITQDQAQQSIEKFRELYTQWDQELGRPLEFRMGWEDSRFFAEARQDNRGSWIVYIAGGLLREPSMNQDVFALAVCHELGHIFGGFPYKNFWFSSEGQSDYYATQFCLKAFWKDEEKLNLYHTFLADLEVEQRCNQVWNETSEVQARALCGRSLMAVKQLMQIFAKYYASPVPTWSGPDQSVVDQTTILYPNTIQCRMDTMLAGALCKQAWDPLVLPGRLEEDGLRSLAAEAHASAYACTTKSGHQVGLRPRCWYHPRL